MAKIIFLSIIVTFIALGFSTFFFLDVNTMSEFTRGEVEPTGARSEADYLNSVVKDDFTIRSIINRVAEECPKGDKECITLSLYDFFSTDIQIVEDNGTNIKPPKQVMSDRRGNSNDIAILFASFLENANIKSRLAFLDNSTYVYACGVNLLKLYDKIIADIHKTILASREVTLRRGQAWAVDLANGSNITVDISAKSSKAFDMFFFANKAEMNAYMKNKDGRYIDDCTVFNATSVEKSCLAAKSAILLFISREDENVFLGVVYKGGLLLSDLESSTFSGESCVPIDFTLSGVFKYPAMVDVSLINASVKAP